MTRIIEKYSRVGTQNIVAMMLASMPFILLLLLFFFPVPKENKDLVFGVLNIFSMLCAGAAGWLFGQSKQAKKEEEPK